MTTDLVISVDAELFVHTPAYRGAEGTIEEESVGIEGLEFLLECFDRHDVTSTFFVVSEIADSHPELVERIGAAGHEIASHTHSHRLLSELDPNERAEELAHSKERLEDVSGADLEGFRAPAFDRPPGFFQSVHDAGYAYDSSVAPARSIPGWYGGEYSVGQPVPASALDSNCPEGLAEVPISVMPGVRLPLSAAWIRLLGRTYLSTGLRWLQRRDHTPVLYVHPWEFVDLPTVEGVPKRVYWHTGTWFRETIEAVASGDYDFRTVGELAASVESADREADEEVDQR